ncbi:PQQ-binding-like beta-propeller repeat protein [Fuerstiella marisgermanici]|uniref:Outer membrane biogenesis protein n=1 Tax=Fuerstiella marisgermanici TaxID=1891926 RepID=A0A1P8WPL9_9PLAN|nr:PQQ-binding-like beta-propeller repeat protein [Fuerstiella marisgermanici]APZ96004.1 outer membrane biogenesis protein [Fuerstiella marisgermanici]
MPLLRLTAFVLLACSGSIAHAADWAAFRGSDGSGVAADSDSLPTRWSPKANLTWKLPLPGPGVSSPIVVGNKVFVTCYSGYGLTQEDPGDIENLMRHLVCVDIQSGEKLWQADVKAALPEDPYTGIGVTAHGYASHTPVSDGKNVYAFFGKSGVHAFNLDGEKLWQAEVGKESDPTKWGSSSSPVLHDNTLIVTASAESQSIIGFDKTTGKELWRQEAEGLDGMWGTPSLVQVEDGRTDLVLCVPKEMWGLDPNSGKLRWFAKATGAEQAHASLVQNGKRVFAFTGRGGGSIALDAGGKGDISDSNTAWTGSETASFGSPVAHDGKLYVVARGVMTIVDETSGKKLKQVRLQGVQATGGRFGSLDYPSPVVAGDRLFYLNGSGQMFVFDLANEAKQIAVNKLTSDKESFGGTPAISDGRMIIRGSKHLYCVADKGETVAPDEAVVAAADDTPAASGTRPGGGGRREGGRGGAGRFDPMSMFNGLDANKDQKVTEDELEGNRMADRLKTLDKDGDKAISAEEFRSGIGSLFGGGRGGRGGGGGGGYRGRGEDKRPDRPQRPQMAE